MVSLLRISLQMNIRGLKCWYDCAPWFIYSRSCGFVFYGICKLQLLVRLQLSGMILQQQMDFASAQKE